MPGVSETRTFDALLTTTLSNYRKKLVDNIFDDYPLLSWMNGKLGRALGVRTGQGNIKRIASGESIVEHLLYETNSTVKFYNGAEAFDTTLQDGMTIARFNWKQLGGIVSITGHQRRANSGTEAMINLIQAKVKQLELTMKKNLSESAYSDGTGTSNKELTGLQNLISATATSGGLNPSTYTWWKADVTTSAGSFAANGQAKMRTTFFNTKFGSEQADVIFTDQTTYERLHASIAPQVRYQDTRAGNIGFSNLTFMGVPVFFDRDCTSGYMYFLNSNFISFVVMKGADMEMTPFVRPENQDVTSAAIIFEGNLTVNDRRKHGVIQGFTA